ncbi:DEAD/DEAH box helicase [[Eubacterium] cellulosolvens]
MSNFQDLGLIPDVKTRLKELEFDELFPIQEKTISPILEGRDVIGQAKTGTGKTAAYAIPIIEKLRKKSGVQALIIIPTRELAQQVANQFKDIAKYTPFRFLAIFGGEPIERQIREIQKADVIMGTPGRLIDHLNRGTLQLNKTEILVIDEADRMLDMGFIDDVKFIINYLPKNRQTCMFSATMPEEVTRLAKASMNNPVKIFVDEDEISVESIEQLYCLVERRRKFQTLNELINQFKWKKILIFVATRKQADWLAEKLNRVTVAQKLHGGLTQSRRNFVMRWFRNSERSIIVATDLAARGIDITDIDCIINYDMPKEPLTYFHRIGRTGRAGGKGTSMSIVSYEDRYMLAIIESYTNIQLKEFTRKHHNKHRFAEWIEGSPEPDPFVEEIY